MAQSGNVDMLRTLIYAQADVNLPDGKSGKTALHHAVDNNDLPVAGFLLTEVTLCEDGVRLNGKSGPNCYQII